MRYTEPVYDGKTVRRFVLASRNRGKLAELSALLESLQIVLTPLPEDAPEVAEDGETFQENAYKKARAAAIYTGLPSIADDSGLCVEALEGAPGIYSARYGSEAYCQYAQRRGWRHDFAPLAGTASDTDRTMLLLQQMAAIPDGQRQASFRCAVSCVWPDGDQITVTGTCAGEIARQRSGTGGFGYDPVFYVPAEGCTFAELAANRKNQISHRGRALRQLCERLQHQRVSSPDRRSFP